MVEPRDTGGDGGDERVLRQSQILKEKIARAQGIRASNEAGGGSRPERDMSAMGRAMRLGSEFVAAILVGAVAGYLLDQWLNTSPWIMLVMVLIGFAAGVLNVVRAAADMNRTSKTSGPENPPGSAKD